MELKAFWFGSQIRLMWFNLKRFHEVVVVSQSIIWQISKPIGPQRRDLVPQCYFRLYCVFCTFCAILHVLCWIAHCPRYSKFNLINTYIFLSIASSGLATRVANPPLHTPLMPWSVSIYYIYCSFSSISEPFGALFSHQWPELTWSKIWACASRLVHPTVQEEVNMADRDGDPKVWWGNRQLSHSHNITQEYPPGVPTRSTHQEYPPCLHPSPWKCIHFSVTWPVLLPQFVHRCSSQCQVTPSVVPTHRLGNILLGCGCVCSCVFVCVCVCVCVCVSVCACSSQSESVWMASTNRASLGSRRSNKFALLNIGPAGSRPGQKRNTAEFLIQTIHPYRVNNVRLCTSSTGDK